MLYNVCVRVLCLSVLLLYSTMWPVLLLLVTEAWEFHTSLYCVIISRQLTMCARPIPAAITYLQHVVMVSYENVDRLHGKLAAARYSLPSWLFDRLVIVLIHPSCGLVLPDRILAHP